MTESKNTKKIVKKTTSEITLPKNFTKQLEKSLKEPKKSRRVQYSVHFTDPDVIDYIEKLQSKTGKSAGAVVSELVVKLVHLLEEK